MFLMAWNILNWVPLSLSQNSLKPTYSNLEVKKNFSPAAAFRQTFCHPAPPELKSCVRPCNGIQGHTSRWRNKEDISRISVDATIRSIHTQSRANDGHTVGVSKSIRVSAERWRHVDSRVHRHQPSGSCLPEHERCASRSRCWET